MQFYSFPSPKNHPGRTRRAPDSERSDEMGPERANTSGRLAKRDGVSTGAARGRAGAPKFTRASHGKPLCSTTSLEQIRGGRAVWSNYSRPDPGADAMSSDAMDANAMRRERACSTCWSTC